VHDDNGTSDTVKVLRARSAGGVPEFHRILSGGHFFWQFFWHLTVFRAVFAPSSEARP
jgi:hypothetical protein